jgi:hypothetical protein
MSQDLPIPRQDSHATEPVTVEWGSDRPARRGRMPRALAGLGRDRRLVPVMAAIGGVAAAASLVGEWTIVTIPMAELAGDAPLRVPAGVSEVGNFGAAYLIGLLAMIGCLALVFAGAPSIRHNARILGLTLSGAVLAVLLAATAVLPEASGRLYYLRPNGELRIEYGRGLVMAFLATAVLGLALLLAGRFIAGPVGTGPTDAADATGHGWSWRRPRPAAVVEADDERRAPSDLTVTAAPPFIRPEQSGGG